MWYSTPICAVLGTLDIVSAFSCIVYVLLWSGGSRRTHFVRTVRFRLRFRFIQGVLWFSYQTALLGTRLSLGPNLTLFFRFWLAYSVAESRSGSLFCATRDTNLDVGLEALVTSSSDERLEWSISISQIT